ncbi:MAG TPA: nucleotidyltransferase domain-containing protein [Clostridiaceae bacterium]|jgi:predicted nucleotidyltransferase|nr:nucleotidyltransferase domain-containing protein [Clostridiaceae bacterium]
MASFDTRERVKEIAREYGKLVKEELDVKNIYLYGSYAKGTYTSDSDIDIAVVGDDFTGDPIEDTLMLMKIRRKIDNRIEPRPFKTCYFNSSNPFAKEIIETGIMII